MSIRFGANPIIWSNDDLRELGAETSLETCLAQARQIGFEGMELGHKFPRDARELRSTLGRFGLACISGWYSSELLSRDAAAELTRLRAHLDLLKALGSTVLVFAEVAARAGREDWSFLHAVVEGVFTVPGDGCVPFDRVFHELRDYSGWVVLEAEQDPKKAEPLTYATLGLRNLRRVLAEGAG